MNQSQQILEQFGEAENLVDVVAKAVEPGDKLIGMGPKIKATGMFKSVDFVTSPMPLIMAEPKKGGKKIVVVNKKNADPGLGDKVVGELVVGTLG